MIFGTPPRRRYALPAALALIWVVAATAVPAEGQKLSTAIRLNQLGFYPGGPKMAVITAPGGGPFHVTTPDLRDTVYTGQLSERCTSALSSDTTRLADFSSVSRPGTYVVMVPGIGYSFPFDVRTRVHEDVARASLKSFYHHRASVSTSPEFAGEWSRPAGHPDDAALVHPSAATAARPSGSTVSVPGGWYDAGDYNKYIVNSGITVATLLSLYEEFPAFAASLDTRIPESGNALPDILDEALVNIRWMLTMQDPADGGVYHKLTEPNFEGFVMPAEAKFPRYVVQKSTAAALDFAAVTAQASRILRRYEHALPGMADTLLSASTRAWEWARRNPDVLYDQNQLNQQFDPDISTGTYGDRNVQDEFAWAAAELYLTTRADSFYAAVRILADTAAALPSWSSVRTLGYYSLVRFPGETLPRAAADRARLERLIVDQADTLVAAARGNAYRTAMGNTRRDFIWGSNAVAGNQGIALIQAFRLTGDPRYLREALGNLDYILGRNATGYSFVTGYGDLTPLHPHDRLSEADGIRAPVPGFVVGGPNPGRQDQCTTYPSTLPDKAYTDDVCSYAANEIAINWNAPLVYLAVALEALQYEIGHDGAAR
ncbi:MAG: glycoside hydrolase family 9 protein [Gemmatimonadetes bacterium]|nr:glycoside hydrolase family 9 protein [Gemmatimonadota bacterium]